MAGKKKAKNEDMVPVLGLQESTKAAAKSAKESEPDYAKLLMEDFVHPRGGVDERIEMDIKRHRMGWGRIVLSDKDGKPVSGAKIRFKQKCTRSIRTASATEIRQMTFSPANTAI